MKRYVCQMCHGRGINTTITDQPQVGEPAEPGYWFIEVPCTWCVAVGAPPFIDVPTSPDIQLEAIKENT